MIKRFFWVLLLASSLQTSWAYSLAGPVGNGGDSWQQGVLGYGGLNAPKNLGEEFRRNTPVMYYAFDANFLGYFGPEGASSVQGAFEIMNALTNVDDYSKTLVEFPLESRHQNYQAQALGLLDLKTETLSLLAEQMGLIDPVTYAWTLHDRVHPSTCPLGVQYIVVQRNYDIISSSLNQLQYSPYVNNTLYSYQIVYSCVPDLSMAVPYSVDPLADTYSPVASLGTVYWGDYYTGLTRDDVAGIRYMLSTNNINWETAPNDSLLGLITTNTANSQAFPPAEVFFNLNTNASTNVIGFYYYVGDTNGGIGYGDLRTLMALSSTNDPATLQAFYTGLVISSVSNNMVWSTNETYSYTYRIRIGSSPGSVPELTVTTNYQGYWKRYYYYQFANVFTNHIYTNTAKLMTTTVGPPIGSPYGSASVTNTTVKLTNQINGDFFVLPVFQAGFCPMDIVDAVHYNVLAFTNYLSVTATNSVTSTNSFAVSRTTYLVTYFTNYSYLINPVSCTEVANATGLYRGIKNVKFIRADYDSLLGQYWQPITNDYTMTMVTNSKSFIQNFRRIVTQPDFLLSAEDLATSPSDPGIGSAWGARSLDFNTDNVLPGLAGPGTINTPQFITYNKVGPVYFNNYFDSASDSMDGTPYFTQTPGGDITNNFYLTYFVWASYDGTTNAPVVFPNGTSIDNLANQMLIKVLPATLPLATQNEAYATTFSATGGSFTQPFTWASSVLPDGLTLSEDGILSGTPTQSGTFDFTLTLTDVVGRTVQWTYTIIIQ